MLCLIADQIAKRHGNKGQIKSCETREVFDTLRYGSGI